MHAEARRSVRLRQQARWQEATTHPFVRELVADTLPQETFARYLIQDYAFIDTLVEVVAYMVARAPDMARKRRLVTFLDAVTGPENTYFQESFAVLGVPEAVWRSASLAPVTQGFRDFLLQAAGLGDYADGLSVLLPVEWVYLTWATELPRETGSTPSFAPYRQWIELHANDDFRAFVTWLQAEVDALKPSAAQERRMVRRFSRAVDFEVAFWQMACSQT